MERLHLEEVSESPHNFLNLLSQLTSGGQDQSLALQLIVVQTLQNASAESCSLASPRLSLLNHVQLLAEGNDTLLLDGGRLLKSCVKQSFEILNRAAFQSLKVKRDCR